MGFYKPRTPARRYYSKRDFSTLTPGAAPEKTLVESIHSTGGRNNHGRVTSRFRGGGHKKLYRIIDFRRDKTGIAGVVQSIEYDPNRNTFIALIQYPDGEKRYILAPQDLKAGDKVSSGPEADIRPGCALPLSAIPVGSFVHNIELKVGKGGCLVRSAGAFAQLVAKDGDYAVIRLPSSELRKVFLKCYASVGVLSNADHMNISWGKAGRVRWLGRTPHNRGTSMNPIDHPHGGGQGKTKGGRHPVTPWGQPTKGYRTRNSKRTDVMRIQRRNTKVVV